MAIRRILVIDDEEAVADWLRNLLKDEGCVVRTAGSAKRGLAEFDKDEWDVVFLDLLLPDMDGLELLGKLNARRSDVAAVLMGERSSTSDGFAARKMGAAGFLEKPADLIAEKVLAILAELPNTETPCWADYGIVGQSAQMQTVFRLASRQLDLTQR
jgi:DNA-binding NtrC family response regulator